MRPATRSSNRLGGRLTRNRGWRRRLLLHPPRATRPGECHGPRPVHRSFPLPRGHLHIAVCRRYRVRRRCVPRLTLLMGPANLLLRRRNPVSSYLRRDVGAWTAIASVLHVILGFQAHSGSGIFSFLDFFVRDGRPLTNRFGLGNWTGLAALVIVVGCSPFPPTALCGNSKPGQPNPPAWRSRCD